MKVKRYIFVIITICLVISTLIVPFATLNASALASKYFTAEGFIFGSRPLYNGEVTYSITAGGDDFMAYRSGFGDLCALNNHYMIDGKCLVRGGIEAYKIDIYRQDNITGEYTFVEYKTAYPNITEDWYSFTSLRGTNYEDISGIQDINGCGGYSFDIDISDYIADQGVFLRIIISAYVSGNSGESYIVAYLNNLSALSTDGQGGGNTDVPTLPPITDSNWYTSVSNIDCKDGIKIASNRKNKTFETNLAERYEPNPTTYSDGLTSINGWCAIPNGVDYYLVDIYDLSTMESVTLDSRAIGVSFRCELGNLGNDVQTWVTNNGGCDGEYWINGYYNFTIDFARLNVDFNEQLVNIRIRAFANNGGDTAYLLAVLSNFVVDFDATPINPSSPISNENIFSSSTATITFRDKQNTDYTISYDNRDFVFDDNSMLNVGVLVYMAYIELQIDDIEDNIKQVTVYFDFPRAYRWRDYNIFVNLYNFIGNDYGQAMGFYTSGVNSNNYVIEQEELDLVVDVTNNKFTRIQFTSVGGSDYDQIVSCFYSIENLEGYELHIGSIRDVSFFNLFSGIYDAQLEAFYGITNFSILGYNISSLLLGLMTLVVVVVIVKKVI